MTREMLAVLVTGDRNCTEREWAGVVLDALDRHRFLGPRYRNVMIHGDNGHYDGVAKQYVGLDRVAWAVVLEHATATVIPMPYIEGIGPAGGPKRNEQMVRVLTALKAVGYATVCLAFHDNIGWSKGTKSCHNLAFDWGHPCFVVRSDGSEAESTAAV